MNYELRFAEIGQMADRKQVLQRAALVVAALFVLPPTVAAADELTERRAIKSTVQAAFFDGRFDELDKLYTQYRTTQERTPSGLWKLTLFYEAFSESVRNGRVDLTALQARLDGWRKKYPQSPAPHIV